MIILTLVYVAPQIRLFVTARLPVSNNLLLQFIEHQNEDWSETTFPWTDKIHTYL